MSITASMVGNWVGILLLVSCVKYVLDIALKFASWEVALLALWGVSISGTLTAGEAPVKGWISGWLGVLLAMWLYGRRRGRTFFQVTDFLAPLCPLGLGAGRIGNFINGELWGKVSDVPWAMVFPQAGPLARHPSQLYQAFLEGLVLFAILWLYARRPRPTMAVSGMFLLWYGVFRFLVELVREPDAQLGYLAFGWITMGQVLSVPMILLGAGLIAWAYRRPGKETQAP